MFILSNFLYSKVKRYLFLSNALPRILIVLSLNCRQIAASFQKQTKGDFCFGQVIVDRVALAMPLPIFLCQKLLNRMLWTPNQNAKLNSQITSSIPFIHDIQLCN